MATRAARCPVSRPALAPSYDVDLYRDAVIRDPWPHYAAMRELGPVVWLPRHANFAVTRYAEVRQALREWTTFSSAQGVAADQAGCDFLKGNTLASDPPVHDEMRVAMAAPLLPGALEAVRDRIEQTAADLVDHLLTLGSFDAIADLARVLPLTVVTDLVGLPEDGRENMLAWAASSFDILGVQNERGRHGLETIKEMRRWIETRATPERLKPGSWTARILELARDNRIPAAFAPLLIRDYINPSLDTTISATGQLIYQLGRNPGAFESLARDPSLVPNAVQEAVRLGSPIRSFSRTVTADTALGDVLLPRGARTMILFASANRDERKFPDPDRFDVTRAVADHVGFGHGLHMCVGMHLARLEMEAILRALVERVARIEVGEPTVALNNTIYGFASLPARLKGRTTRLPRSASPRRPARASGWTEVVVAKRSVEGDGIVSLELAARDGSALAPFEAGSHVDVELGPGLVRQYSLCGAPARGDPYRICVLREPKSRGGSAAVHDRLAAGATLRIGVPRNLFALEEGAARSLLLAGGIGITPILAMAHRLAELGRDFALHYAVRTRARLAFLDEITRSFPAQVVLHVGDEPSSPRLDPDALLGEADEATHLYCCGPAGLIERVTAAARRHGWPDARIHVERFAAAPGILEGAPFRVHAKRSGIWLDIRSGTSILDALSEAGIAVPSSCRAGVCATCLTPVLEGTPDHRDLVQTEDEKAGNGRIAVCCSRSRTAELVLDL